ncbi:hypothetical protein C5167_045541 [Papaver somniferum]|uniref:Uncharacterized protein n=1 Tax=Papaver somniferum TaxID=3469 RepID=A0A4Y7LDZ0_PAPSO|nr:uncharacterized protein LOC113324256 [Papaver somniferum]RZC82758.1 hypothetical protein C5167_045541 [Papaver somniferum]
MGQSLKKLAAGNGVTKEAEIGKIAARTFENMAKDVTGGDWTITDVYRAKHHKGSSKLTPEEFSKMVKDLVFDTGFKGFGAKDIILYMYGVPITMLFIKNTIIPNAIPNDMFIPDVTSATVYALAKFNKI